jgi:hypothetical protein
VSPDEDSIESDSVGLGQLNQLRRGLTPKPITDNTLFYGDNLPILREHVPHESVDLIYLDPPTHDME